MEDKKRKRLLIDDRYALEGKEDKPIFGPLNEDKEDLGVIPDERLDISADVLDPMFDSRQQAIEERQGLTDDLLQQDQQNLENRQNQDLMVNVAEGIQNVGQAGLAPLRGAVKSAFSQTDDALSKSLDAQRQNRVDIRGMIDRTRQQEDASAAKQAGLRGSSIDLRERLGLIPRQELQERVELSKMLDPESQATQGRQVAFRTESVLLDDGSRVLAVFNPNTGRFMSTSGEDITEKVDKKAFREIVTVDPYTQEKLVFTPGSSDVSPLIPRPEDGVTPRDLNQEERRKQQFLTADLAARNQETSQNRAAEIAEAKEERRIQQNREQIAREATMASQNYVNFTTTFVDSLNKSKAISKIPVAGQLVSGFQDKTGLTIDKEYARNQAMAKKFVSEELLRTSGKQVSNAERDYLASILPKPGDDPDMIQVKLEAFGNEMFNRVNQKRREAGLEPIPTPSLPSIKPNAISNVIKGTIQSLTGTANQTLEEGANGSKQQSSSIPPMPANREAAAALPVGSRVRHPSRGILEKTPNGWRPVQ
jgi:hypothetical protein